MPEDTERARLDRLAADGFLTAWPMNVRDRLYTVTDRGRKASKAR
jgi:DNA-binding PadR family transcriptional regulator